MYMLFFCRYKSKKVDYAFIYGCKNPGNFLDFVKFPGTLT